MRWCCVTASNMLVSADVNIVTDLHVRLQVVCTDDQYYHMTAHRTGAPKTDEVYLVIHCLKMPQLNSIHQHASKCVLASNILHKVKLTATCHLAQSVSIYSLSFPRCSIQTILCVQWQSVLAERCINSYITNKTAKTCVFVLATSAGQRLLLETTICADRL